MWALHPSGHAAGQRFFEQRGKRSDQLKHFCHAPANVRIDPHPYLAEEQTDGSDDPYQRHDAKNHGR